MKFQLFFWGCCILQSIYGSNISDEISVWFSLYLYIFNKSLWFVSNTAHYLYYWKISTIKSIHRMWPRHVSWVVKMLQTVQFHSNVRYKVTKVIIVDVQYSRTNGCWQPAIVFLDIVPNLLVFWLEQMIWKKAAPTIKWINSIRMKITIVQGR